VDAREPETVARGKVTALWNWLDRENTAHWWLTAKHEQSHWSSYTVRRES
jgi:hypothetical protein